MQVVACMKKDFVTFSHNGAHEHPGRHKHNTTQNERDNQRMMWLCLGGHAEKQRACAQVRVSFSQAWHCRDSGFTWPSNGKKAGTAENPTQLNTQRTQEGKTCVVEQSKVWQGEWGGLLCMWVKQRNANTPTPRLRVVH
jgi:hypothetical protein